MLRNGSEPRWDPDKAALFWIAWVIGPATWTAAVLLEHAIPGDPRISFLSTIIFIVTHAVAAPLSVALAVLPGRHRHQTEFWLLMLYWASIAALVWFFVFSTRTRRLVGDGHAIAFQATVATSAAFAVSIPVIAMINAVRDPA